VAVSDDELPWYLAFPTKDRDPQGTIMSARVGKVDRSATITEVEDMVEVVLEGEVFFDFDSDELTDEGKDLVTDLAADIADTARPGTVAITGHTDEVGSDDYNDRLSADRAEAVRAVLEEAVDRSDLDFEVEGLGSREPIAPNEIDGRDNPDGRERNRRVEIVYEAQ
jgi:outer membrane protein OmpA-like peptidoglycan-associated protein